MMTLLNDETLMLETRLAALEAQVGIVGGRSNTGGNRCACNGTSDASSITSPSMPDIPTRIESLRRQVESYNSSMSVQSRETWMEIQKLLQELDPDIALTHQQQPLLYKRQQILASSSTLQHDMEMLDTILKLLTTNTVSKAGGLDGANVVVASTTNNNNVGSGGGGPGTGANPSTTGGGRPPRQQQQQPSQLTGDKQNPMQQQQQQQQQQTQMSSTGLSVSSSQSQQQQQLLRLDQVTQAPILVQHMVKTPSDLARLDIVRLKLDSLQGRTKMLSSQLQQLLETYHTIMTAASEKCILADEKITMTVKGKK